VARPIEWVRSQEELRALAARLASTDLFALDVLLGTTLSPDRYPRRLVTMMRTWLVEKGAFDPNDFDGWVRDLEERERTGTFFFSVNRNICTCTR
jgi:hypothetical protein